MTTALVGRIRIAFVTDPFSASPTWVDVSPDVQQYSGVTCTRGQGDRYGNIQPGTMSFTLDNPAGAYTPAYAAGANYPNVTIGRRVRWDLSIDNGASWFPRFDGFIDTWQTSWDNETGVWASCQVQATDRTKYFGRQELLYDILTEYCLFSAPVDYWRFDDKIGTVTPRNLVGKTLVSPGRPGVTPGAAPSIIYETADGPVTDGLTAMTMRQYSLGARSGPNYTIDESVGQAVTFSGFVRCVGTTTGSLFIPFALNDWVSNGGFYVQMDGSAGGFLLGSFVSNAGVATNCTGVTNVMDGNLHHIAVTCQGLGTGSGGRITVYVDGVQENLTPITHANMAAPSIVQPIGILAEDVGSVGSYVCAHFAVYQTALSAVAIANIAGAGLTGFVGDDSQARAARIASFAGLVPTAVGSAGSTSMSSIGDTTGRNLDDLLQDVQITENGAIFFAVDGTLKTVSRRQFDNPTPAMVLPTGSYEANLQHVTDDSKLVNDFTATGSSGNPQEVINAALSFLGTVNGSQTLQTTSDPEALAYAQRRIYDGTPVPRFDTVTLDLLTMIPVTTPYNGVTTILNFWGADLGSVLQCTGLPTGSAPATSMTQQIQGYTETFTDDAYGVTFNTVPTFLNVWKLQDAVFGVLNSTTVLAY